MENSEELKILGFWASPYVIRVEWALLLKGITNYEYVNEEDVLYNKSPKSPLLLQLNPVHKKVPVLIHKGNGIAESLVIVEYIEEAWNNFSFFPQNPCEKARIRSLAKFGDKLLFDSYTAMWNKGEAQEKLVKSIIEGFEKIEEEIKGKKYFGGESLGFLDIAFGWISYWLPVWEEIGSMKILDPFKFPGITVWAANFLSQPEIKEKLPPRDKMVVYFTESQAFRQGLVK